MTKNTKITYRFLTMLTLVLPLSVNSATTLQSHDSIEKAVYQHIIKKTGADNKNTEVQLNTLDPRLRLNACGHPLETSIRGAGAPLGRIAVAVKCSSPKPWKFYLGATVRQFDNIVVAKQGIPRGTVLSKNDIHLEKKELTNLRHGYFNSLDDVINMVAKRTLVGGKAITPNSVNRKQLISRGEKVTIRAILSGVEVRMYGEALADGANGERIAVKNLNSHRIINAVVTSQGIVTVTL
ncbi:MAG: flagellar basal body P-ring formation protein FlgA [Thiotrichales bacterium]|nr:flagellar basal body P-ring formation protein FlgA [Thiotrichales bacterium]